MRMVLFVAALALAAVALAGPTYAADQHVKRFSADISGASEVPPIDTVATGEATLRVIRHGTAVRYRLELEDIENVFVAHIHIAPAGKNGPVVVFLYGPVDPPQSGDIEVRGVFTEDDFVGPLKGKPMSELLALMRSGGAYVNAHTSAHPGGEIRGQIVVEEDDD